MNVVEIPTPLSQYKGVLVSLGGELEASIPVVEKLSFRAASTIALIHLQST
jgi:hypothetical protein